MTENAKGEGNTPASPEGSAAWAALATASREKADAFFAEQTKLTRLQIEEVLREDRARHWSLRFANFSAVMKVTFEIALAIIFAAIIVVLADAVWAAANDDGLVIESFSVPPDLSERGLTGQVIASQLLDRLLTMERDTDSQRDPETYVHYWGEDIKLEIPQTGISLSELDRFLHEKLGHRTHITGEVVRNGEIFSLTTRVGGNGSETVKGAEPDLDSLIQKLAEATYRITEPYRYGAYLREHARENEDLAIFMDLAKRGPVSERIWGYLGWANALEQSDGVYARQRMMRQLWAKWPQPGNFLALQNIAITEDELGEPAQAIRDLQTASPFLSSSVHGGIRKDVVPIAKERIEAFIDMNLGAFHQATILWKDMAAFGPQGLTYSLKSMQARSQVGEHDLAGARSATENSDVVGSINASAAALDNIWAAELIDTEAENWRGVIAADTSIQPLYSKYPGLRSLAFARELPWLAYAHAKLGNFPTAENLMAGTPSDCDFCLRMRGRIAELQGKHAEADSWFAKAVSLQPSIPVEYSDWGAALIARGNLDGAIAKFERANELGPNFSDPLEMWGEALLKQNHPDLAFEKFEEAANYAPNWGHLHLKWGEALMRAAKADEAKGQFNIASGLALSAADKLELFNAVKASSARP